jgi:hypothetical protein
VLFIWTGRQTRRWPATTSRYPCTNHHLAPPVRRSPPCTAPVQEFEEDCEGGHPIVPAGREGEESSWYLEAEKGGECSWPLLLTRQIEVESKLWFLALLQIEVESRSRPSTRPPQIYENLQDIKRKKLLGTRLTSIPPLLDREGTRRLRKKLRHANDLRKHAKKLQRLSKFRAHEIQSPRRNATLTGAAVPALCHKIQSPRPNLSKLTREGRQK